MRRVWIGSLAVVVLLAILTLVVTYPRIHRAADIGAGYVALGMCGCTTISERPFDDCLPDMLPEMDAIRSEPVERDGLRGVRAWVPIYAERFAFHHPPDGCTLE